MFDFEKVMAAKTDAELIAIIDGGPSKLQPEAWQAAEQEFNRRSIPSEQIEMFRKSNAVEVERENIKMNTPLEIHWRILTFLIPMIFTVVLSGLFKANGYDRKAKELVKWTLYGICFYFLLILIIKIIG